MGGPALDPGHHPPDSGDERVGLPERARQPPTEGGQPRSESAAWTIAVSVKSRKATRHRDAGVRELLFARAVFTLAEGAARLLLEDPDRWSVEQFTDFTRTALAALRPVG